jgi:hypothetical protein
LSGSFIALIAGLLLVVLPSAARAQATTTTLTVTSGGNAATTVTSGSAVTLTAAVNSGSTSVKVGQVIFCDAAATYCSDIHLLGTAQLTQAGTATYKFRPGFGSHSYKAVFLGTTSFTPSTSANAPLTVTGGALTTTVVTKGGSAPNYVLTATVSGVASIAPTGSVSFVDTSNGNALLGTSALGTGTAGLNFLSNTQSTTVGGQGGFVVGDFNGDGIPDLAATNYVSEPTEGILTENIIVLLGDGYGNFSSTSTSPSVYGPLAVGDFNGDGKQDLAVAVYGNLTTLLGNGDGTFAAPVVGPLTVSPISVAVGDFNGDGKADLAVSNSNNTVSIFLGNGDGTFTTAASPATGDEPNSLAVGDFNGDGIPDLAVANYGSNTVSILLGNGDGTFAAATSPTTGNEPDFVAVGDFNGDGKLDLAVANFGGNTLSILLGNGDGTFTAATSPAPGNGPKSVAVGDFNGDGILDLAVATQCGNGPPCTDAAGSTTVLLGNGDGTFTVGGSTAVPNPPQFLATGDLNGDGITDFVVRDLPLVFVGTGTGYLDSFLTSTQTATAVLQAAIPAATGSNEVVASYAGDNNNMGSTSSAITVNAAQGVPTVSVTSSPNPASYGTLTTFTATVTGSGPTPTGTVTFYDGTGQLGTGALSASGVATYGTSGLTGGAHSITAEYGGDTNYNGATSPAIALTVNKATPAVSLAASPTSVPLSSDTVNLTATLTGGGIKPSGSVTFVDGTNTLGAGPLSKGIATYAATGLAVGTHSITAAYGGDTNYVPLTSAAVVVQVAAAEGTIKPTVTVTSSASTITAAQAFTVTVGVNGGSGNPTPTGSITLASGSYNASQTLASGTTSFTIPAGTLSAGANTLTASYSGDGTYAGLSGTANVTVSQVGMAAPAPSPVSPGASATGTVTLTASNTYAGTMNVACTLTGSPTGAQSLPTCSLNPASIALTTGASGTTALTVKTTAASTASLVRPSRLKFWRLGGGGVVLAVSFMLGVPSRRRRWISMLMLLWMIAVAGGIGCGGGGQSPTPPIGPSTPATTAGNYVFTVTGTDSANPSITTSASVDITVQ